MEDNLEQAQRADNWLAAVTRAITVASEHVGLANWLSPDYTEDRERANRFLNPAVSKREEAVTEAAARTGLPRETVVKTLAGRREAARALPGTTSRPRARTGR